jgi:hypothetical protein
MDYVRVYGVYLMLEERGIDYYSTLNRGFHTGLTVAQGLISWDSPKANLS